MRTWILPILLLVELAAFTLVSGITFRSAGDTAGYFQSYFADLIAQSAPMLLLSFAMTLILMTGGIDLSVGSMVALIACVLASFGDGAAFWWTAAPAGLAVALALGLTNGLLIARLDVPPIIATLGTMIFYRGLCFVLLGELEKAPFLEVPGFGFFGTFLGAAVLVAMVFVAGGLYFRHSRWREELLMLGGNRIAARYAGVPVGRRVFQVYGLGGLLAFLAALCFTARNGSVSASSLTGLELQVIVAVVLGGTRVQGGNGSLWGAFFGVMLIAVLNEGLRGAAIWGDRNLPFKIRHLEFILLGVLLVSGVWLNSHFSLGRRKVFAGRR